MSSLIPNTHGWGQRGRKGETTVALGLARLIHMTAEHLGTTQRCQSQAADAEEEERGCSDEDANT